jgi:putative ABC transport system permease protein
MNGLNWLFNRTHVGWLQLRHKPMRALVCLAGVAIADLLMFLQLGIVETNYESATLLHRHLHCDLVITSRRARDIGNLTTFPRRRLFQAWDVEGVERVESVYLAMLDWTHPLTAAKISLLMIGIEPNARLVQFDGLPDLDAAMSFPDTLLIDSLGHGDFTSLEVGLKRGHQLKSESGRRTLTVSGLFELGSSFARDGYALTSVDNLLRLEPSRSAGQPSLGLIKLKPGTLGSAAKSSLEQRLPKDIQVFTAAEFIQMEIDHQNSETPMAFVFGTMLVVAFVVGATIVYQILSSDIDEHLAEYATFKAMGYSHCLLLWIVYEEALLACLGFFPGMAGANLLYASLRDRAGIPIWMTPQRIVTMFALTLVMCCISGYLAARKLRNADPADIF